MPDTPREPGLRPEAWPFSETPVPPPSHHALARRSLALRMRDGVLLAVDVSLPVPLAGERVPAIVRQTRYHRSVELRGALDRLPIPRPFDLWQSTRRRFVEQGYAWIDVDARGSGASRGTRPCPWGPEEVADGAEVASFIVAQPWSNGLVGTLGISYDGTASEMLLANRHPAVRASAPMFSLFDVFRDVAFPGGIHLAWFTEAWARFNQTLDRNGYAEAMAQILCISLEAAAPAEAQFGGRRADALLRALGASPSFRRGLDASLRALIAGVRRVDGDGGEALVCALADHADNVSVHEGALAMSCRDDAGVSTAIADGTIDLFSPHTHVQAIRESGAAVLSYGGWFDGGYARGAMARHAALGTPGSRLVLGPWCHAGLLRQRPFALADGAGFDHGRELLRFFDAHLRPERGARQGGEPLVRYYTLGAEKWNSAPSFPPPGGTITSLYLGDGRRLLPAPGVAARDRCRVDPEIGTGTRSRWRGLIALVAADYPDRRARDERLLCYDSPPLEAALEVTGSPVVVLHVAAEAPDAFVFVYLEDVDPAGRVGYVTEGCLRALHRKLSAPRAAGELPQQSYRRADTWPLDPGEPAELVVELQPTSYLFRRGHAVRLAVATADRDHFAAPPHPGTLLELLRGGVHASRLELPVHR